MKLGRVQFDQMILPSLSSSERSSTVHLALIHDLYRILKNVISITSKSNWLAKSFLIANISSFFNWSHYCVLWAVSNLCICRFCVLSEAWSLVMTKEDILLTKILDFDMEVGDFYKLVWECVSSFKKIVKCGMNCVLAIDKKNLIKN